ncbi:MAG: hypothetical protein FWE71_15740 [Nocardioidaceae bacterium]|nr:hypothetical protein [Nocardioidaceae bacterium]MCL2614608.1 hypothetical protein [Nocardioidaceae bacterium]
MHGETPRDWTPDQRALVIRILADVIAMTPDLPGNPGQAARSGALLLLEHACPWLTAEERNDLARTCELAAARHSRHSR